MNNVPPNKSLAIQEEFKQIDDKQGWTKLFQDIRTDSLKNEFTTLAATKNKNKNLNRYRDVSPYDHSRIVLSKGRCDYINANLVKIEKANRHYILTQGPLYHTTGHFWLMIWEQNCKAVIMLNRIMEKSQEKCHLYWPVGADKGGEDELVLSDVGLRVVFVSQKEASYYTTRLLRLKDEESGESRDILQFHYTTWPDFGVPQSPTAFLKFLSVVRRSGALSDTSAPPVVHCSAGIGRSGTFILVDSSLVLMKEHGANSVNVTALLKEMRKYRMGLIQTPDQLRFSYLAIIKGITNNQWDSIIQDGCEPEGSESEESAVESVGSSEDVVSEEDSDSDTPPPPPPPRSESLAAQLPPASPPSPVSSPDYLPQMSDMEKKRIESRERLAQRVADMKRKQEAAENWSRTKRSLLSPFSLSVGALVIGVGSAIAIALYYRE